MARTLHDGVVQRLSSVAAVLGADTPLGPQNRRRCAAELEAALGELRELISGAGGAADEAPPSVATAVGVGCGDRLDLPIDIDCEADPELPPELGLLVRDFVAEAVRNAGKHADPGLIAVTTASRGGALHVSVRNDGVSPGHDGRSVTGLGLGLRLLAAEAARLGAQVDARPDGADGWVAELTVPPLARRHRFRRREEGAA